MQWLYLVGLITALSCLLLIDWRYKLAFFYATKRTILTLSIAIGLFVVWDFFGIRLGIFFHGGSDYTLPFRLFPEFPIEELFFLTLLTYSALLIYRFSQRIQR